MAVMVDELVCCRRLKMPEDALVAEKIGFWRLSNYRLTGWGHSRGRSAENLLMPFRIE